MPPLSVRHLLRRSADAPDDRPLVMGILNVTPDSFSDGGRYPAPAAAVDHALAMAADGADIVDVGPESTRPGAEPVSADEQIARAVPVIEAIRSDNDRITLSIDTRLALVAEAALSAGADIINDVSALRDDPAMAGVLARRSAPVILMHRRGTPADMQKHGGPHYDDVVREVASFLADRRDWAESAGIDPARIILDPGIGFGKRLEHNLLLLRRLDRIVALGRPVLIGVSRKAFIGHVLGLDDPRQRDRASLIANVIALQHGAAIIRVHDVPAAVQATRLCHAVMGSQEIARRVPHPSPQRRVGDGATRGSRE